MRNAECMLAALRLAISSLLVSATVILPCASHAATFQNPLTLDAGAIGPGTNCADPTILRGQTGGDDSWYMICTQDALSDNDRDASNNLRSHLLPIYSSLDLVHWIYRGDALSSRPTWTELNANFWAPDLQYFNGKYYLYFAATAVKAQYSGETNCFDDSGIGVATATSPLGPWIDHGSPVVAPRRNGPGCDFKATIDPEIVSTAGGQRYIFYGSFKGGLEARTLSSDGFTTSAATTVAIAIADRFEGAEVYFKDGFYWLFASANNCCAGPLTGYITYVGRSANPLGPYFDKLGNSFTAGRVGGTTVLAMNGNEYVGPGHVTVFSDRAAQTWIAYHAIQRHDPYFEASVGYTRRPPLLDKLEWIDGWPEARGLWAPTDCAQEAPAARPGDLPGAQASTHRAVDAPGTLVWQDDFDGNAIDPAWSWVRPPASSSYAVSGGVLRINTQSTDLYEDQDNAAVLLRALPAGEWVVEARVNLTVPAEGCCQNYAQGGLVIYGDDDNYLKLVHLSLWSTRQTEFAKEWFPVPAGWPRYGGTYAGTPGDWTWLRVVKRLNAGEEIYTAYSSVDGSVWTRGGSWTHSLGDGARLGLVSMSRSGFATNIDSVRVWRVAPEDCIDSQLADACDFDSDGSGNNCDPDDDNDDAPDIGDCAARDASQGRPGQTTLDLRASTNGLAQLSWAALPSADRYDLTRGALSTLAPGELGACLVDDLAGTTYDDAAIPTAGDGWLYLVRGEDAGCGGSGSWGRDSSGSERNNQSAGVCP